jgi:2,4-dienoyl-CoA reductase-like NADH-dependent reductase (Old Yellow Enzyme family)
MASTYSLPADKAPTLFSPVQLGDLNLRNRIILVRWMN